MTYATASVRLDWRKALYALRARIKAPSGGATVVVGVLKGSMSDVDDGALDKSVPIAPYAAVQEFGSKNVPPRPFLRTAYAEHKGEWVKAIGDEAARMSLSDPAAVLKSVGTLMVGDVRDKIMNGQHLPLNPKTIKAKERKGRPDPSRPLVDTASMVRHIGYEVRNK